MGFSDSFVWGVATASYQIEGATEVDGRAPSVWDMLCRKPGAIWGGHSGEPACDHYHRYKEDVQLMKDLGVKAYRFSIAWPRVMPDGIGAVNEPGLAFYDNLVNELLAAGIEPWVTLYHWDLPLALYHRGGWLNPDSPKWFEDYTRVIVDRLSDRVSNWMTFNEPQVFIGLGMQEGEHAPGDKLALAEVALACHNVMLAHGRSNKLIRERAKKAPKVSLALVGCVQVPATDSPEDVEAARESTFAMDHPKVWSNDLWMDPALLGHYPEHVLRAFGKDWPKVSQGDLDTIKGPLDYYGMNIYWGHSVQATESGPKPVAFPAGYPTTAFRWPITPRVLYYGPKFMYEKYGLPVVMTENGMSGDDFVMLDGQVHDPQRIDYLHRYLKEYRRAAEDGVELAGYFQWSLMDNFEWATGYRERFGLIYVDYTTQRRIPKDSFAWYRNTIAQNGANL